MCRMINAADKHRSSRSQPVFGLPFLSLPYFPISRIACQHTASPSGRDWLWPTRCRPLPCGTSSMAPTPCAAGYIAPTKGASTCDGCEGGTFQPDVNGTTCRACQGGGYCPEGASAVLPCPAGSYSNATNLNSDAKCKPCPAGSSCGTGSMQPIDCTPGSFSDSARATACTPCPRKKFKG